MDTPPSIYCLRTTELDEHLISAWRSFQSRDPDLASPFFTPEFALAVGSVRSDVEVAVWEKDGNVAGFLPFQRGPRNIGYPVGGQLNDFHGWITSDQRHLAPEKLLRALRLRAWRFHRLIACQSGWSPYHFATHGSRMIRLAQGFEHYYAQQAATHCKTFSDLGKRRRMLTQAFGPVTLCWNEPSPEELSRLIAWKREQYHRTGVVDVFQFGWTQELIGYFAASSADNCSGVLSVLRAGDRVVALHLGLRSGNRLHAWFPAYEHEVARWSPGMQLWIELLRAAPEKGIDRIDLGAGDEPFKSKLGNDECQVAVGVVSTHPFHTAIQRRWYRLKGWVRDSCRRPSVRPLVRPWVTAWKSQSFR